MCLLNRLQNRLRFCVFDADVAFFLRVFTRKESLLGRRELFCQPPADLLSGIVRIGKNNDALLPICLFN